MMDDEGFIRDSQEVRDQELEDLRLAVQAHTNEDMVIGRMYGRTTNGVWVADSRPDGSVEVTDWVFGEVVRRRFA